MNETYRIVKVANGWMMDNYDYSGLMVRNKDIYVFTSLKKLAKFIKKLDERENENES